MDANSQEAQQKRASLSQGGQRSRSNTATSQNSDNTGQDAPQPYQFLVDLSSQRHNTGTGLIYGIENRHNQGWDRRVFRWELDQRDPKGFQTVDQLNNQTKRRNSSSFPLSANGYPNKDQLPQQDSEQKRLELEAHIEHQKAVDNRFHPDVRYGSMKNSHVPQETGDAEDALIKRNNRAALSSGTPIFMELGGLSEPRDSGPRYTESEMRFIGRNQQRLGHIKFYMEGQEASQEQINESLANYRSLRSPSVVDDDRYFLNAKNPSMSKTNFKLPEPEPSIDTSAATEDMADTSSGIQGIGGPQKLMTKKAATALKGGSKFDLSTVMSNAQNRGSNRRMSFSGPNATQTSTTTTTQTDTNKGARGRRNSTGQM